MLFFLQLIFDIKLDVRISICNIWMEIKEIFTGFYLWVNLIERLIEKTLELTMYSTLISLFSSSISASSSMVKLPNASNF